MFRPEEKSSLFIDGPHLYSISRALSFDVDYKAMLEYFRNQTNLIRAYYYTALPRDIETPLRPLTDWLSYNGYTIITKELKEFTDSIGRRRVKGNMDIEIACDTLELAESLDHIILVAGDADFRRLIEALQRKGVRVTVASSLKTTLVSDELRRQADDFIEFDQISKYFTRTLREMRVQQGR
jgi:uncharacterized LabA/DUF88 family protein